MSKIRNKHILVTGGAGFIGSHLADRLITEGAQEVVVIDNMFLGDERNLREALSRGVVFYRDDAELLSSLHYILHRHKIDTVFNCATKALNYSFINPYNACSTNITVMLNLLELQRKGMFGTLCHFSTSEVYGSATCWPMDEKHPLNPTTAYASGKASADLILESFVRMFNLDAFIVRPFNNYGPRQNSRGPLTAVIPATITSILNNRPPEIHGTGEQKRDFIYVMDTVDTVLKLSDKLRSGESVNISAVNQISVSELIGKIADMMEYKGKIVRGEARNSDVLCHMSSNEKLRSLIDFQFTPFDDGLRSTIAWYRSQF